MNAPYKQTTIVYGLLNQKEPVQYLRIQRSFLGKGNANDMAKNQDSIYYRPNEIEVKIEKFQSNVSKGFIILEEAKINQEAGTFYSDSVVVYRTKAADSGFLELAPAGEGEYEYRLTVTNHTTGKVTTGKTNLIRELVVNTPRAQYPFVSFKRYDGTYNDYNVEWNSSTFGRVYGLTIRFNYVQYNTDGTRRDTASIDWTQPTQSVSSLSGGTAMSQKIIGKTFFEIIRDSISYRDQRDGNTTIRYADTSNVWVTFKFAVGHDDLNTYINLNKPSTGIVQERPLFTNITNGIGIFASRYNLDINKKLDVISETELKNGITNGMFR